MPEDQSSSPGLLPNLVLMLVVGLALVVFLAIAKSCAKTADEEYAAAQAALSTKQKEEADLKKAAGTSGISSKPYTGRQVPVPNDNRILRAVPVESSTTKPGAASSSLPDAADAPPVPEAAHEVATNSPEGAAMLKDALARIDEAPSDVYPDKAKAKVREGLKSARRIFKVGTVYFEKGGAKVLQRDKESLAKAMKTPAIQEASSDPRAVYFVLGFADRSGDADANNKLSYQRSDAVISVLESDVEVFNLIYPVAVGSTDLVSPENRLKNRAAEVWLVLP